MTRHKYIVRPASIEDARNLAEIHIETWRTDYRGRAPDDYLATLSVDEEQLAYLKMIEGQDTFVFIAEDEGGHAVGLSSGGPFRDEGSFLIGTFSGELYNLYVRPEARKTGLGRTLVLAVSEGFLVRGVSSMMLWTFENYASNTFYKKIGGKIIGQREAEIGGKQVHDLAFGWEDLTSMKFRLC